MSQRSRRLWRRLAPVLLFPIAAWSVVHRNEIYFAAMFRMATVFVHQNGDEEALTVVRAAKCCTTPGERRFVEQYCIAAIQAYREGHSWAAEAIAAQVLWSRGDELSDDTLHTLESMLTNDQLPELVRIDIDGLLTRIRRARVAGGANRRQFTEEEERAHGGN